MVIRRMKLFGIVDTISDIGGFMALFLGVSIISFIEIFYYLFIYPLFRILKSIKNNKQYPVY